MVNGMADGNERLFREIERTAEAGIEVEADGPEELFRRAATGRTKCRHITSKES